MDSLLSIHAEVESKIRQHEEAAKKPGWGSRQGHTWRRNKIRAYRHLLSKMASISQKMYDLAQISEREAAKIPKKLRQSLLKQTEPSGSGSDSESDTPTVGTQAEKSDNEPKAPVVDTPQQDGDGEGMSSADETEDIYTPAAADEDDSEPEPPKNDKTDSCTDSKTEEAVDHKGTQSATTAAAKGNDDSDSSSDSEMEKRETVAQKETQSARTSAATGGDESDVCSSESETIQIV